MRLYAHIHKHICTIDRNIVCLGMNEPLRHALVIPPLLVPSTPRKLFVGIFSSFVSSFPNLCARARIILCVHAFVHTCIYNTHVYTFGSSPLSVQPSFLPSFLPSISVGIPLQGTKEVYQQEEEVGDL